MRVEDLAGQTLRVKLLPHHVQLANQCLAKPMADRSVVCPFAQALAEQYPLEDGYWTVGTTTVVIHQNGQRVIYYGYLPLDATAFIIRYDHEDEVGCLPLEAEFTLTRMELGVERDPEG